MAARFWVGGSANWDAATTTHWSATSGGGGGASVPTSADDVTFDSLSNATAYTVTVTATANCNNLTIGNSLAGVVTFAGSSVVNVFGNVSLATGVLYTNTANLAFQASSGTQTLTSNGVSIAGNILLNYQGVTTPSFTLSDNASIGGNFTSGAFDFPSLNGKTLTMTGASKTFNTSASGGLSAPNGSLSMTGSGAATITGGNTFVNLTRTGTAVKTDTFVTNASQTVTGTLTLGGNTTQGVNRLLVQSTTIGTSINFAVSGGTVVINGDVDFQDIHVTGSPSWTNGGSAFVGDCGGNTGLTTTSPTTQHWLTVAGGSWSTAANWTSRVPLPQDSIAMDAAFTTSRTVTADMPRLGGSIDWTGATWTTALTWAMTTASSLYGSLTLIANLTVSGTQTYTFSGRSSYTIDTKSITMLKPFTIDAPSGAYTLGGNFTSTNSSGLTFNNGTFDLNSKALILVAFTSSNSNTRALNNTGSGGSVTLTGNGVAIWTTTTSTGLTVAAGWPTVTSNYAGATGTRTVTGGAASTSSPSFSFTGGTDTISFNAGATNLNLTGFAGTLSNVGRTLYGNLTIATGMTLTAGTNVTTFAGTSGTQQITSNTKTLDFPVTVNAPGATVQLADAFTGGATRNFVVTAGTFDVNGKAFSCGIFFTNVANVRTITDSAGGGTVSVTGSGTTVFNQVSGNLTITSWPIVNLTYSGSVSTRTVAVAGTSAADTISISVSAGTDTVSMSGTVKNVDFTGFAGTLANNTLTVWGNYKVSTGMSINGGANPTTFAATSGIQQITSNGKNFDCDLTFSGAGGTYQLQDALACGTATTRTITLTAGTLDLNNFTLSCFALVQVTGATTRAIAFGSGTIDISMPALANTVWTASGSNYTNTGTGTIKISGSSANAQTFAGGGFTYNNLWYTNATGSGVLILSGSNTFNDIKCLDTNTQTIKFTAGTTTTVTTFTVTGAAANLITINSTNTSTHTLTKAGGGIISCDYLSVQHSVAKPGAWYAGLNSTNNQATLTAGSGWIFDVPPIPNKSYAQNQSIKRAGVY